MNAIYESMRLSSEQFWFSFFPLVGLTAFFLTILAVFAVRTAVHGLPRSARIVAQGGTPFIGSFIMEFFYWMIAPITRWMVRHEVSPNTLTTWSLLFGMGSAVALGYGWFGLGGWFIMLSAAMDVFDGMVARARGVAGESGDFWDSMADRICDGAAYVGFAIYYRDNIPLFLLVMLALVSSTLVSYARAKAESYGVKCYGGVMQRHERVVYLGIGSALAPIVALIGEPGDPRPEYWLAVAAIGVVAVFSTYTAVRRMTSTFQNLREREARGQGGASSH